MLIIFKILLIAMIGYFSYHVSQELINDCQARYFYLVILGVITLFGTFWI
ncbi:hypothetical protein LCM23_14595 [Cytobacillus kochii]|nr:hypothetical protein [Cytobacillus kochii]MCA1027326.1 hypothetical protein [Cytobacillus kochii]